jgi:hypothetical protein
LSYPVGTVPAMKWWHPNPDEPELHDWWRPLLLAARHVRDEELHWLIHIDDFALFGRADRKDKPSIWRYRHLDTGLMLDVDDYGRPYKFIAYTKGPSSGRFKEIQLRHAVWRVGLPHVDDGVWWRPPSRPYEPWVDDDDGEDNNNEPEQRHLRLVEP